MTTKNYHIHFTPMAEDDLETIYDYISRELFADSAAKKLMAKFDKKIMLLKQMPYSSPKCMDGNLCRRGFRKLIVDNYVALYRVNDEIKEVLIFRIFYGRRDYEHLV